MATDSPSFGTIPQNAPGKPEPFTLRVSDEDLADFRSLLRLSKVGPATWENGRGDGSLGVTRDWLAGAKDAWLDSFDWRTHEAHINSFPNFKLAVQDAECGGELDVHFAALFSARPDATPVIFMHGWPGSFLEFLPILDLLRQRYTPETLPFHAVVPSLPGYTLSSGPPVDRDFTLRDAARVLNRLMVDLGFGGGYVAQGGDVGYFLARIMSATYDECKALHVNFLFPGAGDMPKTYEGLSEQDVRHIERTKHWRATGSAYSLEHGTRPATIGLVLSSSPLALLAWIGEKLLEWVDEPLPLDTILRMVSLYWFTSTFPRCIYPYRSILASHTKPLPISREKPLGYSYFPQELAGLPEAWDSLFPNLKFRSSHSKGGHFAALEQPEALLGDVEKFVKLVGPIQGTASE